jgi:hypothetical protein
MRVFVEKNQSNDIRDEAEGANYANEFRICDFLRFNQPLNSLQEYRKAQGDKEHSVNESTQGLCP